MTLRIATVDDEGRGVGFYRGVRVVVEGAEPGAQVTVVIREILGGTAYGELDYG